MRKYKIITVEDTLELCVDSLRKLGYNIQPMKVRSALTKTSAEMTRAGVVRVKSLKSAMGHRNMNIIKEFEKVRDIPYRIPLFPEEPDECCTGKAEMLFKVFKKGGYEARYRLCTFRWNSLNLPKEIQKVPHDDNSSHTYLEIKM